MKVVLALLLILASLPAARGGIDPVQDYLSSFSPRGGDKAIYSNDSLYRLELDLDGDGQHEVLLSMARDQDGKKGNIWVVYPDTATGYTRTGTITFDPRSFYLGPIEDLGDYGLVTFKPTGEREGMLSAYLFDGVTVREIEIVSVTPNSPTVDSDTDRPIGQAIVDKYMNQAADAADAVTSTNAATLAKQFGLRVAGDQLQRSSSGSASSSQASSASSDFGQSPFPNREADTSRPIPWSWIIVALIFVATGTVVWQRCR